MPTREFKARFVSVLLRVYLAGYAIAWLLLQIRLARAEGFASWVLFGWIVPFFEALLWPALLLGWLAG